MNLCHSKKALGGQNQTYKIKKFHLIPLGTDSPSRPFFFPKKNIFPRLKKTKLGHSKTFSFSLATKLSVCTKKKQNTKQKTKNKTQNKKQKTKTKTKKNL